MPFTFELNTVQGDSFLFSTKLAVFNQSHSRLFEPWCHQVNQLAFPPVFNRTIVIQDVSSMKGIKKDQQNITRLLQFTLHVRENLVWLSGYRLLVCLALGAYFRPCSSPYSHTWLMVFKTRHFRKPHQQQPP